MYDMNIYIYKHTGRKYAANSWIHLFDYMRPNLWGCTGVFD